MKGLRNKKASIETRRRDPEVYGNRNPPVLQFVGCTFVVLLTSCRMHWPDVYILAVIGQILILSSESLWR